MNSQFLFFANIQLIFELAFVFFQVGFKMFLGISPTITNWSPAGDEFSLLIENNPLTDFVELPDGHRYKEKLFPGFGILRKSSGILGFSCLLGCNLVCLKVV